MPPSAAPSAAARADVKRRRRKGVRKQPRAASRRAAHRRDPAAAPAAPPIRLLTAVPLCDGHDSAINTINVEFVRAGFEVIYLGYHRSARDIARAAVQEDVRAVGLSSYNGGHVEFFAEVAARLREYGGAGVGLFGGGGGTITPGDAVEMRRNGADRIFFAGTPLAEMVEYVRQTYGGIGWRAPGLRSGADARGPDRRIARLLSAALAGGRSGGAAPRRGRGAGPLVVGVTGPGGSGKTTLIDELTLRFLKSDPNVRVAILSHDPSLTDRGALLGDRASMIYSQHDRVFMRSLASAGHPGGLAAATGRCLDVLRGARGIGPGGGGFGVVFVETVGVGQEAIPFRGGMVDATVLVMSPDYGARLQLQKIVQLDSADVVVINKSDQAAARTASSEIGQRLRTNGRGQRLVTTVANRHGDAGVDRLFAELERFPSGSHA
jgi:methylmalonyl-CoA mutase cobalamin-binding domain/chain